MEMLLAPTHDNGTKDFYVVSCSTSPHVRHRNDKLDRSPITVADYSLEDCPVTESILIPGGNGAWWKGGEGNCSKCRGKKLQPLVNFVKARAALTETKRIISVCSGATILAAAEILNGLSATSNKNLMSGWNATPTSRPAIDWQYDQRWVRAERAGPPTNPELEIWTSSGVSAGIDMTLTMMNTISPGSGDAAAKYAEYRHNNSTAEWADPWSITRLQLDELQKPCNVSEYLPCGAEISPEQRERFEKRSSPAA